MNYSEKATRSRQVAVDLTASSQDATGAALIYVGDAIRELAASQPSDPPAPLDYSTQLRDLADAADSIGQAMTRPE